MPGSPSAALLLLADGRLPSGGYAHSGGLEPTVVNAGVIDDESFESFLAGRAETVGYVAAAFAAAAATAARSEPALLSVLDDELDARMPSAETRRISRALGRQLARALTGIRPHPLLDRVAGSVHQPVVYGTAAAVFGLSSRDAAAVVLHEAVAGPAAAAVKVLRTDPFAVHAALARMTGTLDELADRAVEHARDAPEELPAAAAPLLDVVAEHHRFRDVRLFAS